MLVLKRLNLVAITLVAILMGYDHLPGATLTRYCSSSLQTTRMAFHAIKAGEGDIFLSGGVECVSQYTNWAGAGGSAGAAAALAAAASRCSASSSCAWRSMSS